MKTILLAAISLVALPLAAQEHGHEGGGHPAPAQTHAAPGGGARPNAPVGHGYIPSRGPAPVTRAPASPPVVNRAPAQPDPQHHQWRDNDAHPETPHVHPERDQWVGHNTGRGDPRYHVDHPWAHGRFTGGFGPRYVYRLRGGNYNRFELDGNFFSVAAADYELCADWDWNNDDII